MISVVLTALSVLLGLVVALVVLLVVMPTRVWGAGEASFERLGGEAAVRWGFGLVTLRISSTSGAELWLFGVRVMQRDLGDDESRAAKKKKKKEKKKAKKKKKKEEGGGKSWFAWLRRYRGTLVRIAGRVLRAFDPRLEISGVVGLGDPADTAALFEILRQLEAVAPERVELSLESEWLEEELDVEVRFIALIWPLHLLLVAVALFFESDSRRMLRAAMA